MFRRLYVTLMNAGFLSAIFSVVSFTLSKDVSFFGGNTSNDSDMVFLFRISMIFMDFQTPFPSYIYARSLYHTDYISTIFVAIFSLKRTSCSTISIVGVYSEISFSSCIRENTSM